MNIFVVPLILAVAGFLPISKKIFSYYFTPIGLISSSILTIPEMMVSTVSTVFSCNEAFK